MTNDSCEPDPLVRRAAAGDERALAELFARHRERLRQMVRLRLDRRLQGRLDPSDVVQEAYLEATAHLGEYVRQPALPLFLWLRGITGHKLLELQRHHLGTEKRAAGRDAGPDREPDLGPWARARGAGRGRAAAPGAGPAARGPRDGRGR